MLCHPLLSCAVSIKGLTCPKKSTYPLFIPSLSCWTFTCPEWSRNTMASYSPTGTLKAPLKSQSIRKKRDIRFLYRQNRILNSVRHLVYKRCRKICWILRLVSDVWDEFRSDIWADEREWKLPQCDEREDDKYVLSNKRKNFLLCMHQRDGFTRNWRNDSSRGSKMELITEYFTF